jgi:hypothetical protein
MMLVIAFATGIVSPVLAAHYTMSTVGGEDEEESKEWLPCPWGGL